MKTVIDANVLFRTLVSGGRILDIILDPNLELFAPEELKEEWSGHRSEMLDKSILPEHVLVGLEQEIFVKVKEVSDDKYSSFIDKAKELLRGHDKDIPFVALALSKGIKVWTYEDRLFKIGAAISTKQLSKALSEAE